MTDRYTWQQLYEAAILETDDTKLPERLAAAKASVDTRLLELQANHGGTPEEQQGIHDALTGLAVLRRELQTRAQEAGFSRA